MQGTWPKVILVVVIVLAILFFAGIGVGIGHHSDSANRDSDLPPAWAQNFGQTFAKPQPLTAQDIGQTEPANCLNQNVILISHKTCTLTIKAQNGLFPSTRRLMLNLQPASARIHATLDQKDKLTVQQDVPGNDSEPHLDIYKDGGTLTISCLSLTACRIPL